jgi:GNAT superfamily N-acetyltransferase
MHELQGPRLTLIDERRGPYRISTDRRLLNIDAIHQALDASYWAAGRPREVVARSLASSLCFGLYYQEREQIGLARIVSDYATFAWLCDVYVLQSHQGAGLGKWLIATVVAHPDVQGLRRFMLATRDAHGLYAQSGFVPISTPELFMERPS